MKTKNEIKKDFYVLNEKRKRIVCLVGVFFWFIIIVKYISFFTKQGDVASYEIIGKGALCTLFLSFILLLIPVNIEAEEIRLKKKISKKKEKLILLQETHTLTYKVVPEKEIKKRESLEEEIMKLEVKLDLMHGD